METGRGKGEGGKLETTIGKQAESYSYTFNELQHIRQSMGSRPRLPDCLFNQLKQLHLLKSARGCRGGKQQRDYVTRKLIKQRVGNTVHSENTETCPKQQEKTKTIQKDTTNRKPIKIININCQSIVKNNEAFEHLLVSTNADVVFGTESWLRSDIKDHEVFPAGYTIHRKDRASRGGGMFIAVKEEYKTSHLADLDTYCEIVWVKLEVTSCKSVYMASYYRPHASDQSSLPQLAASLEKVPKNNSHIWIAGDINLPGFDWPSESLKNNCPSSS